MDRACITVDKATAGQLRRARVDICWAARRQVTWDDTLMALLDHWRATHPQGQALTAAQGAAEAPPGA